MGSQLATSTPTLTQTPQTTPRPPHLGQVRHRKPRMNPQGKDQVGSPLERPASCGKQFKQKEREPVSRRTPEVEKVVWAKQWWPPRAEDNLPEPGPFPPTSWGAEQPNDLTQDLRGTFAYKKVAALSPKKWEPGLGKGGSLSRGQVGNPVPGTLGCASTQAQDVHSAVTTPSSCNGQQKGERPTLRDSESEDLFSDSWEDLAEAFKSPSAAQAPRKEAHPVFLKPISWHREELQHTWVRPGAEPGQSEGLCLPHRVQRLQELQHGAHVLATAVNSFTRHVFTCGLGGLKVWHLDSQGAPVSYPKSNLHWPIQTPGTYLRTCLLTPNGSALLAGGHNMPGVNVWDLSAPSLHEPRQLSCEGLSCEALDVSPRSSLAIAGFSNGTVRIWDLRDPNVVKDLAGRQGEANSIVVKDDTIWMGGLNGRLRSWDLRAAQMAHKHLFNSQITSLSQTAWDDWLLVGLASGQHWLQPTLKGQACSAGHKEGAILGLKFSPFGQWWVSVGTDRLVTIHRMPTGATEFQMPEKSCITCCDVSANNRLIVAGAKDYVSVYQVTY